MGEPLKCLRPECGNKQMVFNWNLDELVFFCPRCRMLLRVDQDEEVVGEMLRRFPPPILARFLDQDEEE